MNRPTLMICVSTSQNTTNVLPALQLRVDNVLIIETSGAKQNNWSAGMIDVLRDRKVNVWKPLVLEPNEDSRIDKIQEKLESILTTNYEVVWNLGGGQKAQQIALWQTYIFRKIKDIDEIACYANPENHLLEIWEYNSTTKKLEYVSVELVSNLTAKEIFKIYGFNFLQDESSLFYSKSNKISQQKTNYGKLIQFEEFRKFFFSVPTTSFGDISNKKLLSKSEFHEDAKKIDDIELKEIFERKYLELQKDNKNISELVPFLRKQIIHNLSKIFNKSQIIEKIKIKNSKLQILLYDITGFDGDDLEISFETFKKLFPHFKSAGFLFEIILKEKVLKLLENQEHNILYAYTNVKTEKQKTVYGEYDLLFVTKWGTISTIDAKTFFTEKKEIDARLLNLRESAGRYVDFSICFPYFMDDYNKNWFHKLRRLPLDAKSKNIRYFMYSDIIDEQQKQIEDIIIDVVPIETFIKKLKL